MDKTEFAVRVEFRHDQNGRCYISSPDLIGLHLAGDDISQLRGELDIIIKDLAWHNLNTAIDKIRWISSLDEVAAKYYAIKNAIESAHTEICVLAAAGCDARGTTRFCS